MSRSIRIYSAGCLPRLQTKKLARTENKVKFLGETPMSKVNWNDHETDMWGYYCESWCKACVRDRALCEKCGLNYGVGQWHGVEACAKVLEAEKAKQLSFPF